MRTEADYRAVLLRQLRGLRPHWIIFHHEDVFTTGVPDISITGNHLTSWWETKRMEGDGQIVEQKKLKWMRMKQLELHCTARYIIFEPQQIFVVPPSMLQPKPDAKGVFTYRSYDVCSPIDRFNKLAGVIGLILQLHEERHDEKLRSI